MANMNGPITNQAIRCHIIKPDVHMTRPCVGNCCVLMDLIPFKWCAGDMSCGRCPCQKCCGLCNETEIPCAGTGTTNVVRAPPAVVTMQSQQSPRPQLTQI